jgi:predicted component of type VI protein secretion system
MPYIEFSGEARPLGPGVLTVGSAPEAGWRIQGRGLEGVHLMLSLHTGGRALLIRGTPGAAVAINGVELAGVRTLLSFGDCVAVGTAELRYRRLAPGSQAPAAYLRDVRRGRLYQLRDRSTIGRDISSTVVIHEPDVSRLHAELVQRDESYVLMPHGVTVVSVNGGRVVSPTTLQEGDEIGIGRTTLRFTTAPPAGSTVSREPSARAPNQVLKEARAQTTFMGAIEARDQRARQVRRRLSRAAAMALVAIGIAAMAMAMYVDAHSPPPRSTRTAHASRRGARTGKGSTDAVSESRGAATRAATLPSSPEQP